MTNKEISPYPPAMASASSFLRPRPRKHPFPTRNSAICKNSVTHSMDASFTRVSEAQSDMNADRTSKSIHWICSENHDQLKETAVSSSEPMNA